MRGITTDAGSGAGTTTSAASERQSSTATTDVEAAPAWTAAPLRFDAYEPPAQEPYVNCKRIAGRVAQRLVTYGPGASPQRVAAGIAAAGMAAGELVRAVGPLVHADRRSAGEVLYAQLSGVTETTLGAMVVVRQHLQAQDGSRSQVTRTMDVRLRRTDGPWSLDRICSVGGTPVPRPERLSDAARRVVNHPNLELPDTARWDIYRGGIDEALLAALARAADRRRLAVSVLRTGHPPNVWATTRPSAHASGFAVDLYAVDGALVLNERAVGTATYWLAAAFIADGAQQVGSPWILPPGGRRSFTDAVHRTTSTLGLTMDEMGMSMDMGGLVNARPFDRAFIDMMIPHHQGANRMARAELQKGHDPALRRIARAILRAQGREIREMRRWRKAWYGSGQMEGMS